MILIDSTIYIDWLRRRVDLAEILEPWLMAQSAACCGIIRAEVIRGVVQPTQKTKVHALFDLMLDLPTERRTWQDVCELGWKLDRQGTVLPLSDLVIAVCAQHAGATVVSTDPHFSKVPGLKFRSEFPRFA
jgi:predicted nucleic acid-binding protein